MSNTFTAAGIGSWSPVEILGDRLTARQRPVVHELLGTPAPAITLLPGLMRKGTLRLLTQGAADAAAGLLVLASGRPITLTAEPAQLSMRFVVTDPGIDWETDTDTDARLVYLNVPFQEVAS